MNAERLIDAALAVDRLGIIASRVWAWPVAECTDDAYDGDTTTCSVDQGRQTIWAPTHANVRFAGINAPEMHDSDPVKRAAAVAARDYLRQLIPSGTPVHLLGVGFDKYQDRVDAIVIRASDGLNVNQQMIDSGHAVPYAGAPERRHTPAT